MVHILRLICSLPKILLFSFGAFLMVFLGCCKNAYEPRRKLEEEDQKEPRQEKSYYEEDDEDKNRRFFIDLPDHAAFGVMGQAYEENKFEPKESPEEWRRRKILERLHCRN